MHFRRLVTPVLLPGWCLIKMSTTSFGRWAMDDSQWTPRLHFTGRETMWPNGKQREPDYVLGKECKNSMTNKRPLLLGVLLKIWASSLAFLLASCPWSKKRKLLDLWANRVSDCGVTGRHLTGQLGDAGHIFAMTNLDNDLWCNG